MAERAGVNERTVYRHFANERGLRDAVMHRLEEEAGIDLDGLRLDDVAGVTARILEYVVRRSRSSRGRRWTRRSPTPTSASASALLGRRRRRDRGLVRTPTAPSRPRMLDVLWSVASYERLVVDWELDRDRGHPGHHLGHRARRQHLFARRPTHRPGRQMAGAEIGAEVSHALRRAVPGRRHRDLNLYAAALDMAEWAEDKGCLGVVISEHHGSEDGYLPSPLVIAAAVAARTSNVGISIAALLLLMNDPIKLAEDLNVLDHLSRGRAPCAIIELVLAARKPAMFGIDPRQRGAEMEERLEVLQAALAGETVTWRGRTGAVRPLPYTEGGMKLAYGGGSPAAARRRRLSASTSSARPTDRSWPRSMGPRPSGSAARREAA